MLDCTTWARSYATCIRSQVSGVLTEGLRQAYGHLGGNRGFFVHHVIQRSPGHSQDAGSFGDSQAERFQALIAHDAAGVAAGQ
jgi:hypothetical protein